MIKNITIPLTPGAQERKDASNIIKYTMLLDYKTPAFTEANAEFITQVMEECQKCCHELFAQPNQPLRLTFFGSYKEDSYSPNSMTFLNHYPFFSNMNGFPDAGIPSMILQDCVMASYHAVLSALSEMCTITIYRLINDSKQNGLQALYRKGMLTVAEKGMQFKPVNGPNRENANAKKSSLASDFAKRLKGRLKAYPWLFNFMLSDAGAEAKQTLQLRLQFSAICSFFLENMDFPSLKRLTLEEKNLKSQELLDALDKSISSLTPPINHSGRHAKNGFNTNGWGIVDSMYRYYLIERIFSFNLFYSLIRNIEKVESSSIHRFSGKDTLDTISSFIQFPNPFSRTYFLRFAFDHIDSNIESNCDFWHSHDIENRDVHASSTRKSPKGFFFDKWLSQCSSFIKIMASHIMPIYYWCFLCILLESIEIAFPSESHYQHLEKAMQALADYIRMNYRDILQPCTVPQEKNSDGLDIVSKKNFDTLYDFVNARQEDIKILQEEFFHTHIESECSLNLPPLDLSLFKGKDKKNLSHIQDFYFDLVLYPVP